MERSCGKTINDRSSSDCAIHLPVILCRHQPTSLRSCTRESAAQELASCACHVLARCMKAYNDFQIRRITTESWHLFSYKVCRSKDKFVFLYYLFYPFWFLIKPLFLEVHLLLAYRVVWPPMQSPQQN